ncbi:MAG: RNA polymerase sigma factor [Verrucomicrobiales bacterium]|nr:RNA polymerase sigma factor [Verrucomicrobiales bacterium]
MAPTKPRCRIVMDDAIRERLAARAYREAFERLLEVYQERVFRLAVSMLRNETAAEDVTQDIFLKVWKALPGYQGAAALSTWLYAIARNTCLTELKRRSHRPTVSLDAPEFDGAGESLPALQTTDPEGGVELDVQALLVRLPEKYRRVVTLFYLEQKSYEEVAALLGLPLGTVKTFLFRARKSLLDLAQRPPRAPGSPVPPGSPSS